MLGGQNKEDKLTLTDAMTACALSVDPYFPMRVLDYPSYLETLGRMAHAMSCRGLRGDIYAEEGEQGNRSEVSDKELAQFSKTCSKLFARLCPNVKA